jgi:hypothetical protein
VAGRSRSQPLTLNRKDNYADPLVAIGDAHWANNSRDAFRPLIDQTQRESAMGFGRGALLWMLGIPLPIILLLALFMHR